MTMSSKTNSHKKKLFKVLSDVLRLVGCGFWITIIVLFIVIGIAEFTGINIDHCKLSDKLIAVIPDIIGFQIASLALIMGLNEKALSRLSEPADDGRIPLRVIFASISVSIMILLITLILSIVFKTWTIDCEGCSRLLGTFVLFGAVASAVSLFHIIFHLFSTGTYLIDKQDKL